MSVKIIKAHSPNFDDRPSGAKIDSLVIHHTELSNIKKVYDIFENAESKVSSHYLIGRDGSIHQFVDEQNRAWHAGVSSWRGREKLNENSIGIELDNDGAEPFTPELMHSLINLCTTILDEHNIDERNVVGHSDIAYWRKVDPSYHFNWKELADHGIGFFPEFNARNSNIYKLNGSNLEVSETKRKLSKLGYKVDNFDSKIDVQTHSLLKAFKRRYTPETYFLEYWDTLSEGRLNELIDKYGL